MLYYDLDGYELSLHDKMIHIYLVLFISDISGLNKDDARAIQQVLPHSPDDEPLSHSVAFCVSAAFGRAFGVHQCIYIALGFIAT